MSPLPGLLGLGGRKLRLPSSLKVGIKEWEDGPNAVKDLTERPFDGLQFQRRVLDRHKHRHIAIHLHGAWLARRPRAWSLLCYQSGEVFDPAGAGKVLGGQSSDDHRYDVASHDNGMATRRMHHTLADRRTR